MRESRSGRSERIALALALAYLAAHLPFLAPSLEDIDSANFALALRDYDVAQHQPHPPGYPVYIALGRLSLAAIGVVAPAVHGHRAEALAFAVWSAIGGAIAVWAAWFLYAALDAVGGGKGSAATSSPGATAVERTASWPAVCAAVLLGVAPLFWLAGLRPLSDLPGLAGALASQALSVGALRERRYLPWAALLAGLSAGIRVQTLPLTLPLLLAALVRQRGAGVTWLITRPGAALLAGVVVWIVPLLVLSGGVDGYVHALGMQAGEDFAGVDMLWSNPTPRRLALGLYHTFVMPWSSVVLAAAALLAAAAGIVATLRSSWRALALLVTGFGAYAVFHLLLQDTATVRYALPLFPAVCWLAARGMLAIGRAGWMAAGALAAAALATSVAAATEYHREAHPAFRAIADMSATASRPAALFAHYSLRRALQVAAPAGVRFVDSRRNAEWLGLVEYWRSGGTAPVWFLADPDRTDLALIDPHAARRTRYRWRVGDRLEFSGTRPTGADWYTFQEPGWFAGEGWALTPETGGVARAGNKGPERQPVEAYVRRRDEPMHLMVGGGFVDPLAAADMEFDLAFDDVVVARWTHAAGDREFLRFIDLPQGLPAGDGAYVRLTIGARSARPGLPPAAVAIRQFDIQPRDRLIYGFAEGWHLAEYENATGVRWRWTSGRSLLRVSPPRGVTLTMRGESPLRYFDEPPLVRITAGGRDVAVFRPSADFDWTITVPAADVAAGSGTIAIETDRVYVPAERTGTADTRRLGLRLFELDVHPVLP